MTEPKISIIVPIYNAGKYLRKCIDSIISQTFKSFELLLIDDGSKDNSGELCDEYASLDKRIRVFHTINRGVSEARNLGIENARGEWIGFVDADDWIKKTAYDEIFYKNDILDYDIICYNFISVFANQSVVSKLPDVEEGKINFIREQLTRGWTVVWNSLFRKDLLIKNKLKFNKYFSVGEDFDFLFKAYYYSKEIKVIDKPLYYYNRTNENSVLHCLTSSQQSKNFEPYLSIANFFKQVGVYVDLERQLSWAILRAKQDYILDPETHKTFLNIFPECHRFISSCPNLGIKIKIMMILLTNGMGRLTRLICNLRKLTYK